LQKAKRESVRKKHRRVKSTAGIRTRDPKKRGAERRTKSFDRSDPSCVESCDIPELEAPRQISPDELWWKEPSSKADGRPFHIISNCIDEIERTG